MKHLPYEDDQLGVFHERRENIELSFTTDKGEQVAFYIPPPENPAKPPAKLVILYPGIQSVALDWLQFVRLEDDPHTGYLLIDYPGRGFCKGRMRPEENYRNSEGALAALARHFGVETIRAELSLLGHSFGTGAALQFALRRNVRKIVLVAPFNTLSQAVARKSWLLAFLMPSRIDNREQIRTLLGGRSSPDITIFHGTMDTSLPVTMGQELAGISPEKIVFHEIPDADHVSILAAHRDLIFHALLL